MATDDLRTAERAFARVSASVGEARRFLRGHLEAWDRGNAEWAAQQVVSELATNAVLHASGDRFTVTLRLLTSGALRVEVADGNIRLPAVRRYGAEATTGRGLALVDEVSREWGASARPDGKVVWCELAPEPEERDSTTSDEDESTDGDAPFDLDAFLARHGMDADGRPMARAA